MNTFSFSSSLNERSHTLACPPLMPQHYQVIVEPKTLPQQTKSLPFISHLISLHGSLRYYWNVVKMMGRNTEDLDELLQQSFYLSRNNVLQQNMDRNISGWKINLGWKEPSPRYNLTGTKLKSG